MRTETFNTVMAYADSPYDQRKIKHTKETRLVRVYDGSREMFCVNIDDPDQIVIDADGNAIYVATQISNLSDNQIHWTIRQVPLGTNLTDHSVSYQSMLGTHIVVRYPLRDHAMLFDPEIPHTMLMFHELYGYGFTWDESIAPLPLSVSLLDDDDMTRLVDNDAAIYQRHEKVPFILVHKPQTTRIVHERTLLVSEVLAAIGKDYHFRFLRSPLQFVQDLCSMKETIRTAENGDKTITEHYRWCNELDIIDGVYHAAADEPIYDDPEFVYDFLEYEWSIHIASHRYADAVDRHQKYIYGFGRLAIFALFRKWYISEFISATETKSISAEESMVWRHALQHVDLSAVQEQHVHQANKDKSSPFMIALYDVFRAMLPHIETAFTRQFCHRPEMPSRKAALREFARNFLWIGDIPVFHNPKSFDRIDDAINDAKQTTLYQQHHEFDIVMLYNGRYAAVTRGFGKRVFCGITEQRYVYDRVSKTYSCDDTIHVHEEF